MARIVAQAQHRRKPGLDTAHSQASRSILNTDAGSSFPSAPVQYTLQPGQTLRIHIA